MTIADKLTYLGETKDLLADAINGYTQVISPDTPFREYAQWIDNIVFSAEGGIASLFDEGEGGFAWSSLPYYQDPAGTTEATWGDPVGLIEDATDNGVEFTQATVTARPVLGRVPVGGRKNLVVNNVDLSTWQTNTLSGTAGEGVVPVLTAGQPDPFGGMEATRIQLNAVGSTSNDRSGIYTGSSEASASSLVSIAIYIRRTDGNPPDPSILSWANGTGISAISTLEDAGDGWWLLRRKGNGYSTTGLGSLRIQATGTSTFGNSADIVVYLPQLAVGYFDTPMQKSISRYDITESGVPEIHYLRSDGTDDSVSTTLPAITNGTVVIAGTNGIWIDDQYNHAGGTFTIGPTTYTNGPSGILGVVGDLIVGGCFAIDRQLTAQERTRVINKLKSMGAPGVFELGPELAVNGDFLTDLSGWSTNDGATSATWLAPSDVRVEKAGTSAGGIRRPVPVGQGTYLVSGQLIGNDIAGQYAVVRLTAEDIVTILAEGNTLSSPGKSWAVATVPASTVYIYLRKAGAFGSVRWASASIRKLELIP